MFKVIEDIRLRMAKNLKYNKLLSQIKCEDSYIFNKNISVFGYSIGVYLDS